MNTLQTALAVAAEQAQAKGQVLGKPEPQNRPRRRSKTYKELKNEIATLKIERDLLMKIVTDRK